MNPNIFIGAVKNYFQAVSTLETLRYELTLTVRNVRKAFLSGALVYDAQAMVILRTDDIPFQEMANEILARVSLLNTAAVKKVFCSWFVCSAKGGIYLHEAIAAGNARCGVMRNSFVVFNTENGTVSFGPGHPENSEMSARLADLLERHKMGSKDMWLHDMGAFFDECAGILT